MVRSQLSRITSLFCCTVACTSLSRCIHKGSVQGHFERCFYFHWTVWTSPLISFRYMKMDRKPKNIMLKVYDYSVMFFFSRDDFTSRVTSPVMCPLQRIGIWRFEAAIRTIIIILKNVRYSIDVCLHYVARLLIFSFKNSCFTRYHLFLCNINTKIWVCIFCYVWLQLFLKA